MERIIIYYSLDGNTRFMAENLAKHMEADLLELKPIKDISSKGFGKYLWGGRQVVLGKQPKLEDYNLDLGRYKLIILGSPVWAGSYVPSFTTFLHEQKMTGKKIGLFCCHAGAKGKVFQKFKDKLASNEILGEIDFLDPLKKNSEDCLSRMRTWADKLTKEE